MSKQNVKASDESVALGIIELVMRQKCGIPKLLPVEAVVSPGEPLSPLEQRILDLYDKLIGLKPHLYSFESVGHSEIMREENTEELAATVDELQKKLAIKDQVVESIITTRPIHRALTQAYDLSAKESMLQGLVDRNDYLSLKLLDQLKHIKQCKETLSTLDYQISTQLEKVKELTAKLTKIIENRSVTEQDQLSVEDKENIQRAQQDITLSEGKVNTLKAVILGLILASGIPWTDDDDLQALVKKCSQQD